MFGGLSQPAQDIIPPPPTVDGEDTIMAESEGPSATHEVLTASEGRQPEKLVSEFYAPEDEIYIFLKTFDAESQTLVGMGTYIVKRNEKIADITRKLLELPSDVIYDHWIESHRYEAAKVLSPDRVLEPGTFYDGIIVIVQRRLSDAAFVSPLPHPSTAPF